MKTCIRIVHKVSHWHIMYCKTSWSVKGSARCQNIFSCQLLAKIPFLPDATLFECSWKQVRLYGCTLLPTGFPFIKGLPAWPLHNSFVLFFNITLQITLHHDKCLIDEVHINPFFPFGSNPKLVNTRKIFFCKVLLPSSFTQDFFFLLLCKEWAELIFTVIDWQYVDWDTYQYSALNSMLCSLGFPFHSVQKPSVVYQCILTAMDRQK